MSTAEITLKEAVNLVENSVLRELFEVAANALADVRVAKIIAKEFSIPRERVYAMAEVALALGISRKPDVTSTISLRSRAEQLQWKMSGI